MEATAQTFPPPAPQRARRPLLGFVLDLLIAFVVMLVTGALAGVAWAVWRGVQLGLQHGDGGLPDDPAQMAQLAGTPGPLAMLGIALVSTASAALVAYYWRRSADRPHPPAAAPAWRRQAVWGWAVLAGVASFLLTLLANALSQQLGIELTPTNLAVVEPTLQRTPWLLLGFAVVAAPMYEELLFRRVLFGRMWRAGRPWLGLVLSSGAFALVHELPGANGNGFDTTVVLWLVYGGMGAIFAWVYHRTGSLWTAIGAHATNNLLACLGLLAGA